MINRATGCGRRLAGAASRGAISIRSRIEASRGPAREGRVCERHVRRVNFLPVPRRRIFALLLVAASAWPAAGSGAVLHAIAQQSGRVRTGEIRLKGLDTQHQYSLLY